MIGWVACGVAACCGALALRGRSGTAAPALVSEAAPPWLPVSVDMMIHSALQRGVMDPDAMARWVASWCYPVSMQGRPISWPPAPNASAAYQRLYSKIWLRCNRAIAVAADEAAGGNQA